MRKYLWIAVIALIACAVYFTSCERIPKEMMDTIMPDADKVEPMEPEPTEMPPEMMPIDLVDVLIYTNRSYWITLEDAEMAAETTKGLLESNGVEVAITKDNAYVKEWMRQTTGDGNVNVIILYGVLPDSVYGAGNTQPDGSIAENWIETTDGDTLLNHADYIAFNADYDVGEIIDLTNLPSVGASAEGGLQNLMDNPSISLRDNRGGPTAKTMIVTSDGMALAPSLVDFVSYRSIVLNQLQGEWFAEKIFASDTGNDEAVCADPVIVRDGDRGRIAIIHGTFEHESLLNGEVAAEIIINYLLAPPMMATVKPPVETELEPEMVKPEPEPKAEYMYWAEWGSGKIRRANLDGSNVQDIVDTGYFPVGITIDLSGGKLYWTDKTSNNHLDPNGTNRVVRANLDGTDIEVLFSEKNTPDSQFTYFQIVLDPTEGKMYWSRAVFVPPEEGAILRANLDGSNVEKIITGLGRPVDVTVWDSGPRGLTLDLSMGKLYWGHCASGKIQRANLDGSNVEDIITGLGCIQDVEFDVNGEKIYWSDEQTGTIHRADIDGSNAEELAGGFSNPHTVVFDSFTRKIYWTSHNDGAMYRANYDGSNQEEIISGLDRPVYLALDVPSQ